MSRIEEAMVQGFPFEVPQEYSNLPQLKVGGVLGVGRCSWESDPGVASQVGLGFRCTGRLAAKRLGVEIRWPACSLAVPAGCF